jgi:hypothetical protein
LRTILLQTMLHRSIFSSFRLATVAMLALLLALAPFVHGHLGQPVQHGWHLHMGAVEVGGSGTAPLGASRVQQAHDGSLALLAHEPPEVEVPIGPGSPRDLNLAWAEPAQQLPVALPAYPALASRLALLLARKLPAGLAAQAFAAHVPPDSHSAPGLPPPALAPPTTA